VTALSLQVVKKMPLPDSKGGIAVAFGLKRILLCNYEDWVIVLPTLYQMWRKWHYIVHVKYSNLGISFHYLSSEPRFLFTTTSLRRVCEVSSKT